jgi:hypothetical protein
MGIQQKQCQLCGVKVWPAGNSGERRSLASRSRLVGRNNMAGRTPSTRKTTAVVCIGGHRYRSAHHDASNDQYRSEMKEITFGCHLICLLAMHANVWGERPLPCSPRIDPGMTVDAAWEDERVNTTGVDDGQL